MLLLIRLSFLLSAGQAIGIPRIPSNEFVQDWADSALARELVPRGTIPRGFRTPIPLDEDVFDPTHVVSNTS